MNEQPDGLRRDISTLEPFFSPGAIAIVGLSRTALEGANSVFNTLKDFGFRGAIHIVNPRLPICAQENVHAAIGDLPEGIDLAIIVLPRQHVIPALEECIAKGIGAAIVITQGFADADAQGARLQERIVQLVRDAEIRVLGPNTIGLANAYSNFTSSFLEIGKEHSPVGLISQSGLFMMGHNIVGDEPAGFGMAVDIGNGCDVGLVDILEYYACDERIRCIQCHLEGVGDGRAFLEAAARINREKPIIAYKSGVSRSGRAAVASHSGAAAGEAQIFEAAFRKAGLVRAASAEELRVVAKAFATYRPPAGERVAIVSFSGGAAIMAMDALEVAGLRMAHLSPATIAALTPLFPDWMEIHNPLDIWMAVAKDFHRLYPRILETVLRDPAVDSVICIYPSFSLPRYEAYDSSRHIAALAAQHPDKPVLCWSYGINVSGFSRRVERGRRSMVFPSLEAAARTLAKLLEYGRTRQEAAGPPAPMAAPHPAVGATLERARAAGKSCLFHEGFEILAAVGVRTVPWQVVRARDGLVDAGAALGFPLCMKVISADVIHKSDSGGVRLNIRDGDGLLAAYDGMLQDVGAACPGATIEGVLLQPMLPGGKEIMIGVKRDAAFGPCVILGAGGVYAEILNDFAFRLAPLGRDEARSMIEELAFAPVLRGVRGEAGSDLEAIVDLLLGVSDLVCAHPQIRELDINPVMVSEDGAVAVDVRIII